MQRLAVSVFLLSGVLSASATTMPAPVEATALKQQRAQAISENQLIGQVQVARTAKDWAKTESLLQKLIAMAPGEWQYRQALGDVHLNQGRYADALADYGAALEGAGKAKLSPDIKQAMALMYSNQGAAYIKLKKYDAAVQAYTRAALVSDQPGTAWFNVCALEYNQGLVDPALAACDKVIAADPDKADAYFIKGSLLMGNATVDAAGKTVAPPGTVEALQRYLQLQPEGPHAVDVKQMLDYLAGKSP